MVQDQEARSRLESVLEICERDGQTLEALADPRLDGVLQAMKVVRAEIVAALGTFAS